MPSWLLPGLGLLSITVLLAAGAYELQLYPARLAGMPASSPLLFLLDLLFAAVVTLYTLFLVYVFTSLREMRKTLKQIEVNTRAPQLPPGTPEPFNPPSSHSPPSPLTPPRADVKYMPKG